MRATFNRRSTPKVKDGRVQRKNRHRPTSWGGYDLDRESPEGGLRHCVTKRDVQTFVTLISDWPRLSERLRRIRLVGHYNQDGMYEFYYREETGVIQLNAWPKDLWIELRPAYFETHRMIFERLGVSFDRLEEAVLCRFTEAQVRAYMLLHVFVHELGHHYDYMHRKPRGKSRGEGFAEEFANRRFETLYPAYVRVFGDPAKSR
ncbi:MAG: hypothetical protein HS116_10500 [Planctomycetes bacterium]|nr:hypothetical protein [Planctomycetota bacterium]